MGGGREGDITPTLDRGEIGESGSPNLGLGGVWLSGSGGWEYKRKAPCLGGLVPGEGSAEGIEPLLRGRLCLGHPHSLHAYDGGLPVIL